MRVAVSGKIIGWGDKPLSRQYPTLYNIAQRKEVSVASIMSHNPLNIGFRRAPTQLNMVKMVSFGPTVDGCNDY